MKREKLHNLGGVQMVGPSAQPYAASAFDRFKQAVRRGLTPLSDVEVIAADPGASAPSVDAIPMGAAGRLLAWFIPSAGKGGRLQPIYAGGDDNPVAHPLGPPTITGTEITVDTMLKQPTRITRMLMDLTLQRFFVDRVFSGGGGVTGGAVVYDQATENELYMDRDVERVESGQEFPLVSSSRRAPKVAEVEKYGGKFYFTDEARDRNDAQAFVNETRRLANTIVRKINARGVEALDAAIAGNGGASTMIGNDWSAAIPNGSNPSPPATTPAADLAEVNLTAEQRELGLTFNILIVSPVQKYEWNLFYGDKATAALNDMGFGEMYSTNRLAAGRALAIAQGQVGEMRVEQPLASETSREGAPLMRQRTWVQSSVRPIFFVTNPFAVMEITGL